MDISRLCIHTETVKPLSLEEVAEKFSAREIPAVSIWRHTLENRDVSKTGQMLRGHGIKIISLVRGGFFPSANSKVRKQAIANNKKAIIEASNLGAPLLVLVCGAEPAQSLEISRDQIREGIKELLDFAEEKKVKLAIEPLHPMYSDTRSAINTLKQANDLLEEIDSPILGVVVDVYHVWWDGRLAGEIKRSGEMNKLYAFHVCDWKVPTEDMLLDRGLMGEGCIPVKKIRTWMEAAGFDGYIEVEIFSKKYWAMDQDEYLDKIIKAYREHV